MFLNIIKYHKHSGPFSRFSSNKIEEEETFISHVVTFFSKGFATDLVLVICSLTSGQPKTLDFVLGSFVFKMLKRKLTNLIVFRFGCPKAISSVSHFVKEATKFKGFFPPFGQVFAFCIYVRFFIPKRVDY